MTNVIEGLMISINTIERAKEICRISTEQPFDIDISSGRYTIDAKSIMGIFSLDLSKKLEVHIHADKDEAEGFIKELDKFLIR